jgi:hypothetical protein
MDGAEAKFWVEEYYEIFKTECTPIGRTVNPRIAMLTGVMCDRDRDVARARGLRGQQFFKWALAHYYRHGRHVPGRTDLWEEFSKVDPEPMAGVSAIGTPDDVLRVFEDLEQAGVDQVIMLQQAAGYAHEDICASLELLGAEVLPPIIARHAEARRKKDAELAPFIKAAMERIESIEALPTEVDAYPLAWGNEGGGTVATKRAVEAGLLWRLQVGGAQNRGA